ncbi:MAG: hypothetical protein PHU49_08665 [Syntrophorhabdaceae bacterium]|nr:hypothetical protein [Syntrophorhabdaceae bacterium]
MNRPLLNRKPRKPPDPDNPLHKVIQGQVEKLLTFYGFFVFPNRQHALSYNGISDLTAIKDGQTYWIEIKRPKGDSQNDYQKDFQQSVEDHGGTYLIIHSFEEAEVFVKQAVDKKHLCNVRTLP